MGSQLPETCREVEINILRKSVHLVGFIWKRFYRDARSKNIKFFFLVCLIFHVMYFPTLISDVGENNRYCSDNVPGVGSFERVTNKIMLGMKVRLCLSNIYYKYWMWIIFMFIILFCVTCVVLLKFLPIFRLLKRLYSREARCFMKLRFRVLCRVALITTNFLRSFRLPVSAFREVIVPYLEQGKFQVFVFLYTAGALHLFNRLLLCISFCPATILTPRVESSHSVTITPAFCNKSDISSEWATRIWQKNKKRRTLLCSLHFLCGWSLRQISTGTWNRHSMV